MSQTKLYTSGWDDYELIDAGGGKKFERWGTLYTIRPEVQAYFKSELPFEEWRKKAHWEFVQKNGTSGTWKELKIGAQHKWQINFNKLKFQIELTKFKHLGLFPEQKTNWEFIQSHLKSEQRFLNLFAYTGAASCAARWVGAETVHVDSVKQLISWAKLNMEHSRLMNIKWVHEDALKFAQREEKRGNEYSGIIMDPPAWGVGAKGEKWKLEDKIDELLGAAANILAEDGFLIVNTYSPQLELKTLKLLAELYFEGRIIETKELWMKTTTGKELYYGNVLRVHPKA